MANVKISELDELVNVANDDYLPIVDTSAGETKKVKNSNLTANKLDKSNIKTTATDGDVEVYSCNYINGLINVKGSSIKVGLSANKAYTTNEIHVIPFNIIRYNTGSEYFSVDSNGVIHILSDKVKAVIAILEFQFSGPEGGSARIFKNNEMIAVNAISNTGGSTVSASIVIPVTKGDLIKGATYGSITINSWSAATWLQVTAI